MRNEGTGEGGVEDGGIWREAGQTSLHSLCLLLLHPAQFCPFAPFRSLEEGKSKYAKAYE